MYNVTKSDVLKAVAEWKDRVHIKVVPITEECVEDGITEDSITEVREDLGVKVIYQLIMKDTDDACLYASMNSFLLGFIGLDVDEFKESAYKYNKENSSYSFYNLATILSDIPGDVLEEAEIEQVDSTCMFTILSNKSKNCGASAILYPELFEEYPGDTENGIIILPSSIHECICYTVPFGADMKKVYENFKEMVMSVNAEKVSAEEYLSDEPLLYREGVIKLMKDYL